MATVLYVRTSTTHQSTERQYDGVTFDKVFEDQISGKSMNNRPALLEMLNWVREGDSVITAEFSRLGRNLKDLLEIISRLNSKGVSVTFKKENLTFTGEQNAMNNLILGVMGSIAEYERTLIADRVRAGVKLAKEKGRYAKCGRKPNYSKEEQKKIRELHSNGTKVSDLARMYNCSRQLIYNYLKAE